MDGIAEESSKNFTRIEGMMADSLVETLIAVGVGALLGFLASIGFSALQGWLDKKGYRARLKQELRLIRMQIQAEIDSGSPKPKSFHRQYFYFARQQLVAKMDAITWEKVLKAYVAIETLRHNLGGTPQKSKEEIIKDNHNDAAKAIDDVIKNL